MCVTCLVACRIWIGSKSPPSLEDCEDCEDIDWKNEKKIKTSTTDPLPVILLYTDQITASSAHHPIHLRVKQITNGLTYTFVLKIMMCSVGWLEQECKEFAWLVTQATTSCTYSAHVTEWTKGGYTPSSKTEWEILSGQSFALVCVGFDFSCIWQHGFDSFL